MADTTQLATLTEIVACLKRRQLLAQRTSGPQFLLIGDTFRLGEEIWSGPVVISPDALFLFTQMRGYTTPSSAPDLLAIPNPQPDSPRAVATVPAENLPQVILEHPDWPVRGPLPSPVVVLLRDRIGTVQVQLDSRIGFTLMDSPLRVECLTHRPALVADFLTRTGWALAGSRSASEVIHPRLGAIAFAAALLTFFVIVAYVAINDSIGTQLALLIMVLVVGAFAAVVYKMRHLLIQSVQAWEAGMSTKPKA